MIHTAHAQGTEVLRPCPARPHADEGARTPTKTRLLVAATRPPTRPPKHQGDAIG